MSLILPAAPFSVQRAFILEDSRILAKLWQSRCSNATIGGRQSYLNDRPLFLRWRNPMFMPLVVSLFGSGLVLIAAFFGPRTKLGMGGVCWGISTGTLLGLCVGSTALSLHCFLTFIFGMICLAVHARPGTLVASSGAAMLFTYALMIYLSWSDLQEVARLRKDFPLESIAARLSYEEHFGNGSQSSKANDSSLLSSDIEFRLNQFEERNGIHFRQIMLNRLHSSTYQQFIMANGFGVGRMVKVRGERIELPEAEPVPLPPKPKHENYYETSPAAVDRLADNKVMGFPSKLDLLLVHDSGLDDFLKPERMGYVYNRDHVAGFQPHQFSELPRGTIYSVAANKWKITQLELISLLKHGTPVAYASERLPRMDELQDAPTRPLTSFEAQAIVKLRHDEDLVIKNDVNEIGMVGSIRATKSCTECHFVKRGALLGAFSYELRRKRPIQPPKRQEQPPQAQLSQSVIVAFTD